jgi:hypothetical protein
MLFTLVETFHAASFTLGPKVFKLFRLKVLFEASLKVDVNYCINHKVPILYE